MGSRTHGKNADFSFNGVAIEGELETIAQNIAAPPAEITSFADAYQNFVSGKKGTTYELAGTLNMAAAGADVTLFGQIGSGGVSTIFDPTGIGPGANAPEYQVTASGLTGTLVRFYRITLPVGGKAALSATLQVSGAVSRAVV